MIHRVQIKTASKPDGKRRYGFTLTTGATCSCYPEDTLDFFALVCLDLDNIYIVPAGEVSGIKPARVWPNVEGSNGRLEQYRELWGQF